MCKFCVFVGMLAVLTLALPGYAQEPGQAGTDQQKAPADLPAARPKMPNVITFESSVGNVHFPHKVHQKMGCKNCHHQIHAKDLITPHDEYLGYSWVSCKDCHNPGYETDGSYYGCAACHHSNLENIADETLNAKVVVHKSCWKCHESGTGAKASKECSFCHVKEQKSMELPEEIATE
jgi:hypothetical protein